MSFGTGNGKALLVTALSIAAALFGCTSNPDAPVLVNHAPEIHSLALGGGRPVIGAGMSISISVSTSDIDGDALSYLWEPEGQFSGSGPQVTWNVPNAFETVNVKCTVSDGEFEDSASRNVEVGRILVPGDVGEPSGGQLHWDGGGAPFYILRGEVEIAEETELVIDGGTTFWCDSGSKLTLRGGFRVEGTSYDTDTAFFKAWSSDGSSHDFWKGIFVNSPEMAIDIQGLYLKNAEYGLDLNLGTSQTLDLRSSKFERCDVGLGAQFIEVVGEGLSFEECGVGLLAASLDTLLLTGCSFSNFEEYGFRVSSSEGSCTGALFSGDKPAAFFSPGSDITCTGNVFRIESPVNFLVFGEDFGSQTLDFRCNYWGDGLDTPAHIWLRIDRPGGQPDLLLEPIADSEFESCDLRP